MYKIDLLEGQGLPIRTRPAGIAVAVTTFLVPGIIALALLGFFLINRVDIAVARQSIARTQIKTDKLSESLELHRSMEAKLNDIEVNMSEVSSSFYRHNQWTGVLVVLVENMPESMVLTDLELRQSSVRKQIPKKDQPDQMMDIRIPVRTLLMKVSGKANDSSDEEVRKFRDRLLASESLKSQLQEIRVSQESGTKDNPQMTSYEIECIFKPRL